MVARNKRAGGKHYRGWVGCDAVQSKRRTANAAPQVNVAWASVRGGPRLARGSPNRRGAERRGWGSAIWARGPAVTEASLGVWGLFLIAQSEAHSVCESPQCLGVNENVVVGWNERR